MALIAANHRKWWILGAMGGVLGLIVLDETVVGVALPTMRRDLGLSETGAHWIVNAYLLVLTGCAVAGGRLGDRFGHRGFFAAGMALFGLASCAAGFAQDGTWIITARALQGLGAAVIFPATITMITGVFPPEQRGLAFGVQVAMGGFFISLGPLVGGLFTDLLSWRWIFWINLPVVAAIALIVLAAWPSPHRDKPPPGFDLPGLVAFVAGLSALVAGLMQAAEWGWGALATIALLAGGALALAAFVALERRAAEPLIRIDLFERGVLNAANLVIATGNFSKIAVIVFGALYLQKELSMNPLDAGLALLPAVVPTLFCALLAGRLTDRFGARGPALIGVLLHGVALLALAGAVAAKSYGLIVAPLVLWGCTLPFLAAPTRRAVMNAVEPAMRGQAGGINLTAQLLGGTIGMAVLSLLFVSTQSFPIVFLASAAVALAGLAIAWRYLK
ncbi:MAG: MFS transporter [Pseudomonadota bacterium]